MANWHPGQKWRSPITVVAQGNNHKVGNAAFTHASQASCPLSCLFHPDNTTSKVKEKCYANTQGRQPFTTNRLNSNETTNPTTIARLEAQGIDALKGDRDLRVHVVGDSRTPNAARIVGDAMVRYEQRSGFKAWTYTHSWKHVPYSAWGGASVMASVHSADEIKRARAQGCTAFALAVAERHPGRKAYTVAGHQVIPCPAQFKDSGVQCYDHDRGRGCNICKHQQLTVAFQPDSLPKVTA